MYNEEKYKYMCAICWLEKNKYAEQILRGSYPATLTHMKKTKEPESNKHLPRCPVHPSRGVVTYESIY